ncbi:MAG: hypothetical protein AUK34_09155 [Ignavibacteria bacterium CG2_30_36_16]|nr:hypothetical protein [Ignavibacteria bacterium]OIP58442.1 MAG: hypothetical protein AUK34_09155 [Ignavibacteria bacterium CG2_30_36_16]PJB02028.1 MAG: hypothetical protein CO127_00980 [Ignavibacteria bacterium CG_4_9_14_3_um_filter_36_18]
MKRNLLFGMTLVIMMILAKPIAAQDHGFGLGLILGEPTGLSAKLWTTRDNALDFGLGVSVGGDRISHHNNIYYDGKSRVHFHMDYLWHSFNAISTTERFPLYYGLGGRFNTGGGYDGSFGARGVFGIAWFPHATPIDVFLELVPVLQITPDVGFGIDAGLGIRYFFE